MSLNLRRRWQRLRDGTPGRRFQDRYRASRRDDRKGFLLRVVRLVLAAFAVAIGVVLVFIPGPAILFFAIAGTLLASESCAVARFLDWSELEIRQVVAAGLLRWRRSSATTRCAALITVAAIAGAAGYVAYRVLFS